jgi:hypothetical protein
MMQIPARLLNAGGPVAALRHLPGIGQCCCLLVVTHLFPVLNLFPVLFLSTCLVLQKITFCWKRLSFPKALPLAAPSRDALGRIVVVRVFWDATLNECAAQVPEWPPFAGVRAELHGRRAVGVLFIVAVRHEVASMPFVWASFASIDLDYSSVSLTRASADAGVGVGVSKAKRKGGNINVRTELQVLPAVVQNGVHQPLLNIPVCHRSRGIAQVQAEVVSGSYEALVNRRESVRIQISHHFQHAQSPSEFMLSDTETSPVVSAVIHSIVAAECLWSFGKEWNIWITCLPCLLLCRRQTKPEKCNNTERSNGV